MSQSVSVQMAGKQSGRKSPSWPRVFKSAFLYPVMDEAGAAVSDVSDNGLSGQCALTLSLYQQVHLSFDDECYFGGQVRWVNGQRFGLLTKEPLPFDTTETDDAFPRSRIERRDTPRQTVDLTATLVTCAPVLIGTIRHLTTEGMMIETSGVDEGTRLLVKTRGQKVRMGRVASLADGMARVLFSQTGARASDS